MLKPQLHNSTKMGNCFEFGIDKEAEKNDSTSPVLGVSAAFLLRFFLSGGKVGDHSNGNSNTLTENNEFGKCGGWGFWYLEGDFGKQSLEDLEAEGYSSGMSSRAVIIHRERCMKYNYHREMGLLSSFNDDSNRPHRNVVDWLRTEKKNGESSVLLTDKELQKPMETWQVVNDIVKPMTEDKQLEWVQTDLDCDVGVASHFASHAWGNPFVCLVEALVSHQLGTTLANQARRTWSLDKILHELENVGNKNYYWIDLFCKNQWLPAPAAEEFRRSIREPGKVVVCLHPFPRALPFSRIWCIFELMTVISEDADLVCSLSHSMYREVGELMYESDKKRDSMDQKRDKILLDIRDKIIGSIDVRNATASVESDIAMILDQVSQLSGGANAMNDIVRHRLDNAVHDVQNSFSGRFQRSRISLSCASDDNEEEVVAVQPKRPIMSNQFMTSLPYIFESDN